MFRYERCEVRMSKRKKISLIGLIVLMSLFLVKPVYAAEGWTCEGSAYTENNEFIMTEKNVRIYE